MYPFHINASITVTPAAGRLQVGCLRSAVQEGCPRLPFLVAPAASWPPCRSWLRLELLLLPRLGDQPHVPPHANHMGKTCHTLIGNTLFTDSELAILLFSPPLWGSLRRSQDCLISNPAASTSAMDFLRHPRARYCLFNSFPEWSLHGQPHLVLASDMWGWPVFIPVFAMADAFDLVKLDSEVESGSQLFS